MDHHDPLGTAAETALLAPSIFNTQPWRWTIRSGRLELWGDRTRQLDTVDPDGRLLTLSCVSRRITPRPRSARPLSTA